METWEKNNYEVVGLQHRMDLEREGQHTQVSASLCEFREGCPLSGPS